MTASPYWKFGNIGAEQIPALKSNCDISGGSLEIESEPGGNFTVACARPAAAGPVTDPVAPASSGTVGAAVSPTERDTDPAHLHPGIREKVAAIQSALESENIPLRFFEGFRLPQRQAYLYAQGRTAPGPKVTGARPWHSYHQYGLAADFVRFENGGWNWNNATSTERAQWDRYHEIAREHGMEPLSFEKPHVQLPDHSLTRLMNGDYPGGGDESWAGNLSASIVGWGGGNAPPVPEDAPRPSLALTASSVTAGGLNWHSMFGGDAWAYDGNGVYSALPNGQIKTWRTPGPPVTVWEILTLHGDAIRDASARHGVSQALIVMTIATETSRYRRYGFTGPETFRWEPAWVVRATGNSKLDGKEKGDYSAGPMQVVADTARWVNTKLGLGHDNATDFKFFKNQPSPPATLGLYDARICIDVGAAYIRINMPSTGDDPVLVAAAYNAGGLYPSSGNHWRIKSYGNHIDRAAEWYGDACAVLNA